MTYLHWKLSLRRQPGARPRVRRDSSGAGSSRTGSRTGCASSGRALARISSGATPRPTCSCCRRAPRRTEWWSPKRLRAACPSSQPTSAASRRLWAGSGGARPGILVPRDNPDALAGSLRRWLGDAEIRRTWRCAARERRASLLGWSATTSVLAECSQRRRDDRRAHTGQLFMVELREPADAGARSRELVERLRRRFPAIGGLVIHDLASGTGSMGRWLAPLLPGPQRWYSTIWTRISWTSPQSRRRRQLRTAIPS